MQRLVHKPSLQEQPFLHIVLLDTSGSMMSKQALSHAKGILKYFCNRLYQQRDQLTVITFGNQQVEIIFDAKPAPKSPEHILNKIKGGGGTPLSEALQTVREVSLRHQAQAQSLLILTDGRVQTGIAPPNLSMPITCIDMENEAIKLAKVKDLADKLGGEYLHIKQLQLLN